jgi:hypothetical protein
MLMKNKFIPKFLNEEGQALVEFVLFLPFMLMTYSIIMNVSNAINASLNQQKVTRAYFYYRMQNNSTLPKPRRSGAKPYENWGTFGMQIIGWAAGIESQRPVAACFKFNIPLGKNKKDVCNNGYTKETTQFIRVGTVYGVCGATYSNTGGSTLRLPSGGVPGVTVINSNSCLID